MKKVIILLISIVILCNHSVRSQGCIAIRNLAGFGQFAYLGYAKTPDTWSLDINNRYFKPQVLFIGKENHGSFGADLYEYTVNIGLTKILAHGWSLGFDMPIAVNTGVFPMNAQGAPHRIRAFGIGDIRLTAYKWLFDENVPRKVNIQLGLGIKFPTGNSNSVDYWYISDNPVVKRLGTLLELFQLGDGGTGITTAVNVFYIFNRKISVFGNFFYVINPMNTNGVPAYPSFLAPPSVDSLNAATTNNVNSVPDVYTLRTGANYAFDRLVGTVGFRFEGSPAHDLFGDNDGLRRVGYIFSIEPGLNYKFKKSILYTFVTLPLARATLQTVPDQREEQITGKSKIITAGHFANWLIFFGYTFTF